MSYNRAPRRPNLNFLEMGLKIGSTLRSSVANVTVRVESPKRVRIGSEVISLTEATRRIIGHRSRPTHYWKVGGRSLGDIYQQTYGERRP